MARSPAAAFALEMTPPVDYLAELTTLEGSFLDAFRARDGY